MLTILFLISCELYEYSPTAKLAQVVVGASDGELYLTSDLVCDGHFIHPEEYSIGRQITRCKYSLTTGRLLCKNIADDRSIIVGLNTTKNDYFEVKPSQYIVCHDLRLKKPGVSNDGEEMSGWTTTEDPLDNN